MDGEMESIRCKEDVVSISTGRERAAFDGGVETFIGQVDSTLKKIFNLKQGPLVVSVSLVTETPFSDTNWSTEILSHT
jgi:hypothetical protein